MPTGAGRGRNRVGCSGRSNTPAGNGPRPEDIPCRARTGVRRLEVGVLVSGQRCRWDDAPIHGEIIATPGHRRLGAIQGTEWRGDGVIRTRRETSNGFVAGVVEKELARGRQVRGIERSRG